MRRAGGIEPGQRLPDFGEGAAGRAGVVFERDDDIVRCGVVDDVLGAFPGGVVFGWRGLAGEEAHNRRAERGCGVDVLAQLALTVRGVVEEGGLGGVGDQQAGVGDAAGRVRQFGVELRPCLPPQLDAVGADAGGDFDDLPDGSIAALQLVFKLHGGDQDRSIVRSWSARSGSGSHGTRPTADSMPSTSTPVPAGSRDPAAGRSLGARCLRGG